MIYDIPLIERFTQIGRYDFKEKLMVVDGIGLYVKYGSDEDDLSEFNIRRHLIGIKSNSCIIEAETPEEALRIFHEEWEGAKCGEDDSKALYIDKKGSIIEYPSCRLYFQRNGRSICFNPDWEDEDVDGNAITPDTCSLGCILSGSEPPKNCPIQQYKEAMEYSSKVEEIGGFKFKRYNPEELKFTQVVKDLLNYPLDDLGDIFYKARKVQDEIKNNSYIKRKHIPYEY